MKSYFKTVHVLPFLLIVLIVTLAGCSQSSASMAAPAAGGAAAPAAAARAKSAAEPAVAQASADEVVAAQSPAADGRKIIANAHVDLLTGNPKKLADAIPGLAAQNGGYISAANLKSNGDLVTETAKGRELAMGTITLRVPPAKIEAALAGLEGLATEVKSKTIDRQDVTDQYTDLDAQLRNLTAAEEELRVLLKEVRAKPNAKPEDILTVHEKVTQIRAQIEQLQGRKTMLDNLVALSTIEVAIFQFIPAQPQQVVAEPAWQPWLEVKLAKEALFLRLQQLTDRTIWLVIYRLPILLIYLIPLSILGWLGRWLWQRLRLPPMAAVSR